MARFSAAKIRRVEYGLVLSMALFAAGVGALSVAIGGAKLAEAAARASPGVLLGMLALAALNYGLRIVRWQIFSMRLSLEVPFRWNALYYVAGFAMGTTPGKLGEAFRLWLIERRHGYRYERIAPLFIGDRLADLHALLILSMTGLVFFPRERAAALALAGLALLATFALVRPKLLLRVVGGLHAATGRRARRLFGRLRTAIRHTARLFDGPHYALPLALGLMGWAAECFAFAWILATLGADIGFPLAAFIFTFSIMAGAATMLPGGLGSSEAAMIGLLKLLGVDLDTAVVATVAIRLATLWFGVGLGLAALGPSLRLARRSAKPARMKTAP